SEVERGRLALDGGVGGEDDLAHGVAAEALEQSADLEILRTDAVERRQRALQHVIPAAKATRAIDRDQIAGLLDHANDLRRALAVRADRTRIGLGEPVAGLAEARLLLQRLQRVGEAVRQAAVGPQDVEGQARGGLLADPRKLR